MPQARSPCLRSQRQFHRAKRVGLVHRCLCAVADVMHQLPPKGQFHILAINVMRALLIHQEQVIAAGPPGDIHILAHLDIALRPDHRQPRIPPCGRPFGRKPVHPQIAGTRRRAQQHIAKVLQLRELRVVIVCHLRRHDLDFSGLGEIEELVKLMRRNVNQDPAIAFPFKKPPGTRVIARAVWPQPHGIDHRADHPRAHQLRRARRRPVLQPFAVIHCKNAPGRGLHALGFLQLRQRGKRRLVAQKILAVLHGANADPRAFIGDACAHHQVNGRILQNLGLGSRQLRLGIRLAELLLQLRFRRVIAHQLRADVQQQLHLPINMAVIHPDHGKSHRCFLCHASPHL